MKLYDYLPSGNSYKVRWVMARLGLTYTHVPVDIHAGETHTDEFLALNPAGQIPLLITEHGVPLAESNAIIQYLAEGSELIPMDAYARARVLQWQFWEQYRHEPAIAVARFIMNYQANTRSEELPALTAKGYAALDVMEDHLGDTGWFVGPTCTLADVSLYAYTHVAEEGGFKLKDYPNIRDWLTRFAAQERHVPMEWTPPSP